VFTSSSCASVEIAACAAEVVSIAFRMPDI
jgi:hypothetical protein